MMLWYKAWRESRGRFLLGLAVVAIACGMFLMRQVSSFAEDLATINYTRLVWESIYMRPVPVIFALVATLLGLGGLQVERMLGTAGFTLTLPFTRRRLVLVRAVVGLLELGVLSCVPALVILGLSFFVAQQHYPVVQAFGFALLFLVVGAVWFAAGFLWSNVPLGSYTVTALALLTPFAYMALRSETPLVEYPVSNWINVMSGRTFPYLDTSTYLLTGVPWLILVLAIGVTLALLAAAIAVAQRQDF